MKITGKIRFVERKDLPQVIALCQLHAEYERSAYDSNNKLERLEEALFAPVPKLYCLVAESNGELIGYATYMEQYATWDAATYIYMDCLFIKESARGLRIGEKLVKRMEKEGRALDCTLMQWQTPDFNTRAMKFYHRIGASSKSKERFFLTINPTS